MLLGLEKVFVVLESSYLVAVYWFDLFLVFAVSVAESPLLLMILYNLSLAYKLLVIE